MRMFAAAGLFLLAAAVCAQDGVSTEMDFNKTVSQGQRDTAHDAGALKAQRLIQKIEETLAVQDGELEALETVMGVQEPLEEPVTTPVPARRWSADR